MSSEALTEVDDPNKEKLNSNSSEKDSTKINTIPSFVYKKLSNFRFSRSAHSDNCN